MANINNSVMSLEGQIVPSITTHFGGSRSSFGTQYNTEAEDNDDWTTVQHHRRQLRFVIVIINGVRTRICTNWLLRCLGEETTCNHAFNNPVHGRGYNEMVCPFHLKDGCTMENHPDPRRRCKKQHHIELLRYFREREPVLAAAVPTRPSTQRTGRKKTATCMAFMHKTRCPYRTCSFAHGVAEMKDSVAEIDAGLKGRRVLPPFQRIMEFLHWTLVTYKEVINQKKLENSEARLGDIKNCSPVNFPDFLDKIYDISRMKKQVTDQFTGETRWEPNRPDIGISDEQFEDLCNIRSRLRVCQTHVDFEILKLYKDSNLKLEKICNHSVNCSKGGCHVFEGVRQICFDDLCGLRCKCEFKTEEESESKMRAIKATLDIHKADLDKTTDVSEIHRLKLCIEKYVKDLVKAHPKIHLSSLGVTLKDPIHVEDTSHVSLTHSLEASVHFEFNDPKFMESMKAKAEENKLIRLMNEKTTMIANAFRSYKFRSLKLTMNPRTNPEHLEYLSSGAFFVGLSLERFLIVKEEFSNWSKYWRHMSYSEFHAYVLEKKEIWNKLGITTQLEEDVVVEVHIPSEKDDYLNFWTWLRNVPIYKDVSIIGDAADVVEAAYDLFLLYKEECKSFSMTFSEWITVNPAISKAVDLMREHSVTYLCAKRYVELDVVQSGMSVKQFSMYNPNTVKQWMKINYELPFLGYKLIDIDTFIRDNEYYVEYILGGWWMYYEKENVGGLSKYISDKQNGWKYIPLKATWNPSLQKSREDKIKAE